MADNIEFLAADAEFLLNHPVLTAAFDGVREEFVAQIEAGLPDKATQDGLMIGLQVLKDIRERIYDRVSDAVIDKHKSQFEEY